jgi:uncharacterized iron-regulated membrane protein
MLVSQPLHFGYHGLPMKILWALLDIIAIVVLGSGFYLWFNKRNVPIEEQLYKDTKPESDDAQSVEIDGTE